MSNRILVPLDGSLDAELAIPVAAQLTRQHGGTVMLTHIAPVGCQAMRGDSLAEPLTALHGAEMDVYARVQAAAGYLGHAAAHTALAGVRTETGIYSGPRLSTILAASRASQADMIVIYDHDGPATDGQLLGTLADQLCVTAEVPVLVLRRDQTLRGVLGASRMRPLRAVVGLDGSPHTEAQLQEIGRLVGALAAPGLGALHLVHVAQSEDAVADAKAYLSAVTSDLRHEMLDEHALLLTWSVVCDVNPAAALGTLTTRPRRDFGVKSFMKAIYGPERSGEIDPETFDGADLLVVADRASRYLRSGRTSDTLERVLQREACPLLVIRPRFARTRATVRAMPTIPAEDPVAYQLG